MLTVSLTASANYRPVVATWTLGNRRSVPLVAGWEISRRYNNNVTDSRFYLVRISIKRPCRDVEILQIPLFPPFLSGNHAVYQNFETPASELQIIRSSSLLHFQIPIQRISLEKFLHYFLFLLESSRKKSFINFDNCKSRFCYWLLLFSDQVVGFAIINNFISFRALVRSIAFNFIIFSFLRQIFFFYNFSLFCSHALQIPCSFSFSFSIQHQNY